MFALGRRPLIEQPVAFGPLHDPPSVTVTPLGTVSTGGPELTVNWSYSQPQGDAQEWWRVLVYEEGGDDFYDTGWRAGSDSSHVMDVDELGIPHDFEGLAIDVYVRGPETIGVGELERYEAADQEVFDIEWGVPHCTITSPANEAVHTETDGLTVAWAFTDDRAGKTQSAWRAILRLAASDLVEWDTGWVSGAESSFEFPVGLRDGSAYEILVQLKNNHGIRSD